MMPAADGDSTEPERVKSLRLSEFQPVMPMTMKTIRMPILISTMMALTVVDSLAPRMSRRAHRTTRMTAGRLNQPPCSGALDRASGISNPNRLSRNWLRYCDHPTATAAPETPYSSSRHAATPIAVSSPRVA